MQAGAARRVPGGVQRLERGAGNLEPGLYRIEIKVNDNISKQTVGPTATFSVE